MRTGRVSVFQGMKKLFTPAAVGALALALASCGGASNNHQATSSGASPAKALVDASGLALYTPDGESTAKVRCTGSCTSIWKPVAPSAVPSTASKVGVITRPDGSKQATVAGKPLYTFAEDSPGAVTGNGVSDVFAGRHFTWHVVNSGGGSAAAPAAPSGGGGSSSGY
jgi:predicted lipoprotein with Yx(FWY)xxD motif